MQSNQQPHLEGNKEYESNEHGRGCQYEEIQESTAGPRGNVEGMSHRLGLCAKRSVPIRTTMTGRAKPRLRVGSVEKDARS